MDQENSGNVGWRAALISGVDSFMLDWTGDSGVCRPVI